MPTSVKVRTREERSKQNKAHRIPMPTVDRLGPYDEERGTRKYPNRQAREGERKRKDQRGSDSTSPQHQAATERLASGLVQAMRLAPYIGPSPGLHIQYGPV